MMAGLKNSTCENCLRNGNSKSCMRKLIKIELLQGNIQMTLACEQCFVAVTGSKTCRIRSIV